MPYEPKPLRLEQRSNSKPGLGAEALVSKGQATAERILDAAFKSIATKGCGAVTLRGIAEEAGVVLSQLSYYYGNKDSLFAAVLKRMQRGYLAALDERLAGRSTLSGQIIALVEYNESILKESPDTYRNFLEFFNFAMSSEAFRLEVADFITGISTMIEGRIARHEYEYEEEEGRRFSVAAVTRFILSATFGISLQHLLNPDNRDIQAGFDIIKATTARRLEEQSRGKPTG
jgi:AcrR family transcriptional regulator